MLRRILCLFVVICPFFPFFLLLICALFVPRQKRAAGVLELPCSHELLQEIVGFPVPFEGFPSHALGPTNTVEVPS